MDLGQRRAVRRARAGAPRRRRPRPRRALLRAAGRRPDRRRGGRGRRGAPPREVAAEAADALAGKHSQLRPPDAVEEAPGSQPGAEADGGPSDAAAGTGAATAAGTGAATAAETGAATAVFTVTMPHGLHARPAALVVAGRPPVRRGGGAAQPHARRRVRPPRAACRKVATLGALQGHELEVRASGPQADAAVAALVDLARHGFGETGDNAAAPPPRPRSTRPVAASPGIGIGPARPLRNPTVGLPVEDDGTPDEHWRRLQDALRAGPPRPPGRPRPDRRRDRRAPKPRSSTPTCCCSTTRTSSRRRGARIDAGAGPARAWADSLAPVEADAGRVAPTSTMQARAADVRDVRNRVVRMLGGARRYRRGGRPRRGAGRRPT